MANPQGGREQQASVGALATKSTLCGVLMAGVMEYYAVLEPDQASKSDSQQPIIARALEHAGDILKAQDKNMLARLII